MKTVKHDSTAEVINAWVFMSVHVILWRVSTLLCFMWPDNFMIFAFILCVLYFESHSGDVTWPRELHGISNLKGITWWAGNVSVIQKVFPYHYVFWIRTYQPISHRQSRDTNSTMPFHYSDDIMGTIVYSTAYSDADQRKHQSSASLAFVRGIHRGPVNSPHKWPVTRKIFPFDDVIMWGAISGDISVMRHKCHSDLDVEYFDAFTRLCLQLHQ